MGKRVLSFALMALWCAFARHAYAAKELALGDPAPKLTVKKFVKGSPISSFEKGKVYVVEFWATWCPPCREAIPHLTELAKKHKDVTFIGVSAFEQTQTAVVPFVEKMGAKMEYHVAMDAVADGKGADTGQMAVNWLNAANEAYIPVAFIVDKESRIAWIGFPKEMEDPLSQICADKWDLQAATEKRHRTKVANQKVQELHSKLDMALQAKDFSRALDLVSGAIKDDADVEPPVGYIKVGMLHQLDRDPEATIYANTLVDGPLKDDVDLLSQLAYSLVDPRDPKKAAPPLLEVAVRAALRADTLRKGEDADVADTLAAAYFVSGQRAKAIATQERAVKLGKGTDLEKDLMATLEKYKKSK